MIKANKKIGIVYCAKSNDYVEEFEKIITNKRNEGYCVETIDHTFVSKPNVLVELSYLKRYLGENLCMVYYRFPTQRH